MSDQNNEFERDMLARELYMLYVQRFLKVDDAMSQIAYMDSAALADAAYAHANSLIEARERDRKMRDDG